MLAVEEVDPGHGISGFEAESGGFSSTQELGDVVVVCGAPLLQHWQ